METLVNRAEPTVVLGMHRSGTSLVAKLLREAGVFMGEDLDSHGESRSLRKLNRFLLRAGHAHWDHPLPFRHVLETSELCDALVRHLEEAAQGKDIQSAFFGRRAVRFPNRRAGWPHNWGWKDPRNTLTLPLWLRVFPELRAIHVVRNGIDVANSLVERERVRVTRLDHPARSARCLSQKRAFELWTEYIRIGLEHVAVLPEERVLTICYEELVLSPQNQIERLFRFAGIAASASQIAALADSIDATRAYAYRKLHRDAPPGQLEHRLMRRLGYGQTS